MKEYKIDSLSCFVEAIKYIRTEGFCFFRGQDSIINQPLLPSLLRQNVKNNNRIYSNECDRIFLNTFKARAIPYLDIIPQNDWEWMVVAQHFGLPTRLLDWSESALAALFFAVDNNDYKYDKNDNPVVWGLNPMLLNEKSRFIENNNIVPNIMENNQTFHENLISKFGYSMIPDKYVYPIAIICPANNKRITAQKGVFTLFSLNSKALEDNECAENFLVKLVISQDVKFQMKLDLFDMGITYSNMFPELEYISKDIKFDYVRSN